jgi:hypothetical protein
MVLMLLHEPDFMVLIVRVGQDYIFTVYIIKSLQKNTVNCIHRTCMVLANPTHFACMVLVKFFSFHLSSVYRQK